MSFLSLFPLCFRFLRPRYGATRQPQSDRLLPSLGEAARTTVMIPATFVRPSGTSQVPADALTPAVGSGGGNLGVSARAGSAAATGSVRNSFLLSKCAEILTLFTL